MAHEYISYQHGNDELEGYFAFPEDATSARPLVLIAHAWRGRDEFVCQKADELSQLGFNAFAMDFYGKGILGSSVEENSRLMQPFMDDRNFLRQRLLVAFETAKNLQQVDKNKIGAIGFCFGGLCVLDLARSGIKINGVVSFHGLLGQPKDLSNEKIQAKILVLHGYNDPMVPMPEVESFAHEMELANADWQIHMYGKTQHAFTNPEANDTNLGTIYNSIAAKRSWNTMKAFFEEIFE